MKPAIHFATTVTLFLGGPFLGFGMSPLIGLDADLPQFLFVLVFPAILIAGMFAWLGLAILALPFTWWRKSKGETGPFTPPTGSFGFVIVAIVLGVLVSSIAATWPGPHSFMTTLLVGTTICCAYGVLCWQLAKRGYLPFPEEA
ncbi:MAG: hypothetical protein KDC35_13115 [Acidobacteria bacterium]|nr:hypothetical protein [Acidobacteriota bacterium]